MQRLNNRIVFSASDLVGFLACEHLLTLERLALDDGATRPKGSEPSAEVIQKRGIEHEAKYLEQLKASGKRVVEIKVAGHTAEDLLQAERETLKAMKDGAEVVFQATFFDGTFRGHADFLLRIETPSPLLGEFSYEVADTKLSRTVKARALLQMCAYSEQVERLQVSAWQQ